MLDVLSIDLQRHITIGDKRKHPRTTCTSRSRARNITQTFHFSYVICYIKIRFCTLVSHNGSQCNVMSLRSRYAQIFSSVTRSDPLLRHFCYSIIPSFIIIHRLQIGFITQAHSRRLIHTHHSNRKWCHQHETVQCAVPSHH